MTGVFVYNRMPTARVHSTYMRVNVVRMDLRTIIEHKPISEQIQMALTAVCSLET